VQVAGVGQLVAGKERPLLFSKKVMGEKIEILGD
jgi:hypothetical protein